MVHGFSSDAGYGGDELRVERKKRKNHICKHIEAWFMGLVPTRDMAGTSCESKGKGGKIIYASISRHGSWV
jgi:hypothetical protein